MIKKGIKRTREKYIVTLSRKADYKSGLKTVLSSSKSRDKYTKLLSALFSYLKLTEYLKKHRSCLIIEDLFHPAIFISPEVLLQEIKFLKRLHVTRMISAIISRDKKIKIKDIEEVANLVYKGWKFTNREFNVAEFYRAFLFQLASRLDFVNIIS